MARLIEVQDARTCPSPLTVSLGDLLLDTGAPDPEQQTMHVRNRESLESILNVLRQCSD